MKVQGPLFDWNRIFKKEIFLVHLFRGPKGGGNKKFNKNKKITAFAQIGLGKIKNFEGPSNHGS